MAKEISITNSNEKRSTLVQLAKIIGFSFQNPESFLGQQKIIGDINQKEIEELIVLRNEARKNKKFKKADQIRIDLKLKGIVLEDTDIGTKWKNEK